MKSLVFLCWAAFCCAYVAAFIPNNGNDAKVCSPFKTNLGRHSKSKLRMSLVLEPTSTLLAEKEVIDVLTDEVFGPIFLGGIGIMVATVVAAFAVGKLIELSGEEALFADELSGKADRARAEVELIEEEKKAKEEEKKLEEFKGLDDYSD